MILGCSSAGECPFDGKYPVLLKEYNEGTGRLPRVIEPGACQPTKLMFKRLHVFLVVAVLSLTTSVFAQSVPSPTPQQLEMLRALPASERQALMDQFGLSADSLSPDQRLEFPELVMPVPDEGVDVGDEPRVDGGETLVVSFAIREDLERSDVERDLEDRPVLAALPGTRTYETNGSGVLEIAGVNDVLAKSQGSSNPHNVIKATFDALSKLRSPQMVAKQRGISTEKLFNG